MISLPFLCHCTELKVYPNNWTDKNVSLKKEWYIFYRFYDPVFRSNPKFKKGKLVIIKRGNQFKTIQERQGNTKLIMEQELDRLQNNAYNPNNKMRSYLMILYKELIELETVILSNHSLTQTEIF